MEIYKDQIEIKTEEAFPDNQDTLSIFASIGPSIKSDSLTEDQKRIISSSIADLSSEGVELILESIDTLTELMSQDFYLVHDFLVDQSTKTKLRIERLLELLHEEVFIEKTLALINLIINNTAYHDKCLIEGNIAIAISEILKQSAGNDANIMHLFTIASCLAGRNSIFFHQLFELQFYSEIGQVFQQSGEEAQEAIASFIEKSTHAKSLNPVQSSSILELVSYLLESSNPGIIECGYSILKRLAPTTLEVEDLLYDGRIIQNFNRVLQDRNTPPDFIQKIIDYLSVFSSLGSKIVDLMDDYQVLNSIGSAFDTHNDEQLMLILNLLSNILTYTKERLDRCFWFLTLIDIIFIFENCAFDLKKKAINVLRLSINRACSIQQILQYFSPQVLSSIVFQLTNNDDQELCYDGLFLISMMISRMEKTEYSSEFQQILGDEGFFNSLQNLQANPDYGDLSEFIEHILSFTNSDL